MPYVKPTVHLSRIAGAALKSFTHGYAQTVVAASQSSYAAQNTSAAPLADTLVGKFRRAEKSRLQNVHNQIEPARQAGSTNASSGRPETSHQDVTLDKYLEAWQKHQRNGTKDLQHLQLARRVEWQPPTTVPAEMQDAVAAEEVLEEENMALVAPTLKRSYTTSALDNFDKAFINDHAAEAAALEQVNNAIAEEIRSRDDLEDVLTARTKSATPVSPDSVRSQDTLATPNTSFDGASSELSDEYTDRLLKLLEEKRYADIPVLFYSMLQEGVNTPTQSSYRALLKAAIEVTPGKHLKAPKALEVYSDMLRRRVVPDAATYDMLISLLATRSSESLATRKTLEKHLTRYGGLEGAGKFMFHSSQSEHAMLAEDNSLLNATGMFIRASSSGVASLSSQSCASLIIANAEQGRIEDMTKVYEYMQSRSLEPDAAVYPAMIEAHGASGNLRAAVDLYDTYKALAIANNAGENTISRIDNEVYAALIKAYGASDRMKGGLKLLSSVQSSLPDDKSVDQLREVVALKALLPLALKDTSFAKAFELAASLTGRALTSSLTAIAIAAADIDQPEISLQAFDSLAQQSKDLAEPSMSILAMHVRNANVEAAEPFWRILEAAPVSVAFVQPTTMRAVALIAVGQAERGLRQSRRMFARVREAQPESRQTETGYLLDEAIEVIGNFLLKSRAALAPEATIELLRMMVENSNLISPVAEHVVARFGPDQIARLTPADLELLMRVQCSMILEESPADIAGPSRFGCLLENIVSRSMMPTSGIENMIEKTLVNIDRAELSRLWNNYRYPTSPAYSVAPFTPVVAFQAPVSLDDATDPYLSRTDIKGSSAVNEMLERSQVKQALEKFRTIRRLGRVPRMFTYGKLIEAAAKDNKLSLAHEVLEMAKHDVPFDVRYRVVRFGWQQIMDHMIAGCLNVGRRDLAEQYHQDLINMGLSPSANTYGLYITTLKENTKTFDEATEAVEIFRRAQMEGVEPTSFLFNALIGKLGKARRIDDCLWYYGQMQKLGIKPTSVTYGTLVNACIRVSKEEMAEQIFEEMEACPNYKPRPAPYHSLMQHFNSKQNRSKFLAYYQRMQSKGIEPTAHTYKLLIETHATIEPINMAAAESVIESMRSTNIKPDAVHYSTLIHAKGCVLHDMEGAKALFDSVIAGGQVKPQPAVYQALFESLNANHRSAECESVLEDMAARNVEFTPYIANALIHGWTMEKDVIKARKAFERVPMSRREPSTYDAMVRAYMAAGDRKSAMAIVREMNRRGYPSAVADKTAALLN